LQGVLEILLKRRPTMKFTKTLEEMQNDMFERKLRDVQPDDEVGALRARRLAERQAVSFHEIFTSLAEAGICLERYKDHYEDSD